MRQWRSAWVGFALLTGLSSTPVVAAAKPRVTPSGQPVPRYVSTKFATINARSGPGDDYKLLWTFHARRLPLEVIAETEDWRRVCDPEGGVSWVHRRTVAESRTVLNPSDAALPLLKRPSETARPAALLAGHAVAALKSCGQGWCRLEVDRVGGWARQDQLWGTAEGFQCRGGASPAG